MFFDIKSFKLLFTFLVEKKEKKSEYCVVHLSTFTARQGIRDVRRNADVPEIPGRIVIIIDFFSAEKSFVSHYENTTSPADCRRRFFVLFFFLSYRDAQKMNTKNVTNTIRLRYGGNVSLRSTSTVGKRTFDVIIHGVIIELRGWTDRS